MTVGEKSGVFACGQLIAWAGQIDIDRFNNPGRRVAQHDHTIAEVNCFFEIVRDENHGHSLFAA
jgi:hypothetical protein